MTDLILDYSNCLASTIGATHGLTDAEIDTLVAKFPKHHENMEELRASGENAFFELPYQDPGAFKELAKRHRGCENVVTVGVGGATIGPATLMRTLFSPFWNALDAKARKGGPRVFFVGNPDSPTLNELVETLDLKKTLFQVVTKSGNTAETVAVYLWLEGMLKKRLGKGALSKHVVVATDTARSVLAEAAAKEKIDIIPIASNLSDRFNVLGQAAMFPAALCGMDVDAFLTGAADMDKRCRHHRALENPAYMHSLIHYLLTRKRRKTIHAMMAFSSRLEGLLDWYSHLLSVSLGKMLNKKGKAVHVGPSPAQCLGSSGCYGQMQLYQEGPFDKVVTFLTVQDHGSDVAIPQGHEKIEGLGYLAGSSLNTMLDQAYIGAAHTLTATGRPNMTVVLDKVGEGNLGGLLYMLKLSTVMSAELYGIDAFNQPGVDTNKQAVFAQIGRAGFEDKASVLAAYRQKPRRTC